MVRSEEQETTDRINPEMPLIVPLPNGEIDDLPGYYRLVTRTEHKGHSPSGTPMRGPVTYAVRPLTAREMDLLGEVQW